MRTPFFRDCVFTKLFVRGQCILMGSDAYTLSFFFKLIGNNIERGGSRTQKKGCVCASGTQKEVDGFETSLQHRFRGRSGMRRHASGLRQSVFSHSEPFVGFSSFMYGGLLLRKKNPNPPSA